MANIQAFISQYQGQKVEVAGGPQFQCVDCVNRWLQVNGLPIITGRNAIDFRTAPGYTYVKNIASYLPPTGSIAIFNIGAYGHVSVVAPGTTLNDLVSFDQNWPVGSPCKLVTHRLYAGVLGFLLVPGASASRAYTVRSGDTLSRIAGVFGTTYQNIAQMNGIAAPYIIRPGQVLQIP